MDAYTEIPMAKPEGFRHELGERQINSGDSRQVKNIYDLVVGKSYRIINLKSGPGSKFTLISLLGAKSSKVSIKDESDCTKEKGYLDDMGVIPYKNGKWNPYNYLVKLRGE